jgi:hypothetical protein
MIQSGMNIGNLARISETWLVYIGKVARILEV